MTVFDPFTATLAEAEAQPDAFVTPRGAVLRWGDAQLLNEKKSDMGNIQLKVLLTACGLAWLHQTGFHSLSFGNMTKF